MCRSHSVQYSSLACLSGIALLEPGIEHAVREDEVRYVPAAQREPDRQSVELPDAVDDDGVVAGAVARQPAEQAPIEGIAQLRWPECDQAGLPAAVTGIGRVAATDVGLHALQRQRLPQLPQPFRRASGGGVDRRYDMEDLHVRWLARMGSTGRCAGQLLQTMAGLLPLRCAGTRKAPGTLRRRRRGARAVRCGSARTKLCESAPKRRQRPPTLLP